MADSNRGDVYTLELAEDHIATANGNVDRLNEIHAFGDSQVPNTPGTGNGSALFSLAGTAQHITDAGLTGALPATLSDTGQNTVTQASSTPLSAAFTVPANDANVGTAYRLIAWGTGTQGTSNQTLTLSLFFGGSSRSSFTIGTGEWTGTTSTAFRWKVELIALCATTGAGGTWSFCMSGYESATGNIFSSNGANNTMAGCDSTAANVTVDTTVSNSMLLEANWGATTGGPTLTCRGQTFERIGP